MKKIIGGLLFIIFAIIGIIIFPGEVLNTLAGLIPAALVIGGIFLMYTSIIEIRYRRESKTNNRAPKNKVTNDNSFVEQKPVSLMEKTIKHCRITNWIFLIFITVFLIVQGFTIRTLGLP